jgi:hypothetical protein
MTTQQLMEKFEYLLGVHGEDEFPLKGCRELLGDNKQAGLGCEQEVDKCLRDCICYAKDHPYPTPGLVEKTRDELKRILNL